MKKHNQVYKVHTMPSFKNSSEKWLFLRPLRHAKVAEPETPRGRRFHIHMFFASLLHWRERHFLHLGNQWIVGINERVLISSIFRFFLWCLAWRYWEKIVRNVRFKSWVATKLICRGARINWMVGVVNYDFTKAKLLPYPHYTTHTCLWWVCIYKLCDTYDSIR